MKPNRKLTQSERSLLCLLIDKASINLNDINMEDLLVIPMDDGKMGSLLLLPCGIMKEHRSFGKQISEFCFKDADGVEVIASLNTDNFGDLYELDIWKTDFSPLIKLPS